MDTKRIKEIIKYYEEGGDLQFIKEFEKWVSENVFYNITYEISYILEKSREDADAPYSYEDIEYYKVSRDKVVFEWWAVSGHFKYWMQQAGGVFLEDYWGRTTRGQSIVLDKDVQEAFILWLKDML